MLHNHADAHTLAFPHTRMHTHEICLGCTLYTNYSPTPKHVCLAASMQRLASICTSVWTFVLVLAFAIVDSGTHFFVGVE